MGKSTLKKIKSIFNVIWWIEILLFWMRIINKNMYFRISFGMVLFLG